MTNNVNANPKALFEQMLAAHSNGSLEDAVAQSVPPAPATVAAIAPAPAARAIAPVGVTAQSVGLKPGFVMYTGGKEGAKEYPYFWSGDVNAAGHPWLLKAKKDINGNIVPATNDDGTQVKAFPGTSGKYRNATPEDVNGYFQAREAGGSGGRRFGGKRRPNPSAPAAPAPVAPAPIAPVPAAATPAAPAPAASTLLVTASKTVVVALCPRDNNHPVAAVAMINPADHGLRQVSTVAVTCMVCAQRIV